MRLIIDLQGAQNDSRTRGIGRYVRSFAKAMVRNARHDVYVLLSDLFPDTIEDVIALFDGLLPREKFIIFSGVGPVAELTAGNAWRQAASELLYEKLLFEIDPDAVIIASLFEGSADNSVASIGRVPRRHIAAVILYDLIPLLNPQKYLPSPAVSAWYFRKLENLKRADLTLAISESSRSEALMHLGKNPDGVINIGTAASEEFEETRRETQSGKGDSKSVLRKFGITKKFLMHTSAYEPRKNFEGLVRAFARLPKSLRSRYQLVFVCSIDERARRTMMSLAATEGLSAGELILTGYVSDAELVVLYTESDLFVFPSFHEGFGLPALEAMACGTPTIGSNNSSIIEVIGRSDALFNPHSVDDIAKAIERALTDEAFRESLRAHGPRQAASFDWNRTARITIAALEAAVAKSPVPHGFDAPLSTQTVADWLFRLAPSSPASDNDLINIAMAMARNEHSARIIRARATAGKALDWRIEGPFDSSYSLALLNRETARALDRLGHRVILHSTEGPGDIPVDEKFLARNPDIAAMHAREARFPQGQVDITSRNLFPPRVNDMASSATALHHYNWEETGFPQSWADDFNTHLALLTCASRHVRKTMIDNGICIPVDITGVGVDHWERIEASRNYRLRAKRFRFLHVSSCFPRKGIDVLLEAYGRAFTVLDDVTLIIKTFANPHNQLEEILARLKRQNPDYPDVHLIIADLSEADLKALYAQCDVLVAPSMAEGFGLPIAEAMMSGLPAIVTAWSGHLDFCNESNSWLVDYRFERAKTHFNLFSSAWARVDVAGLAAAMEDAHGRPKSTLRAMAAAGRGQLLAEYRWDDVGARLVNAFRAIRSAEPVATPRIGWVTTWNSKCGIATYSSHLLSKLDSDVVVFAAEESETTRPDDENCVRNWRVGKITNGLAKIGGKISQLDLNILVIQFNYSFFNHDELAALIADAHQRGCIVVMVLHATVDPVHAIPGAELHLIADSLRLCDRLLVHSVGDLNRLKDIGLIDNVALFPHGVLRADPGLQTRGARSAALPLVSTFGFMLPNKGILETVEAAAILRDRGTPVRLQLVNAEYPAAVSPALIERVRDKIRELQMEDLIQLRTEFLDDQESLALLAQSDLIAFAYQETGESASGAVRYGLAAQRPVAVTPLAIFDDLDDAVFRFDGVGPVQIADGIATQLDGIARNTDEARRVAEAADLWRQQHDYAAIGKRLHNIFRALLAARPRQVHQFEGSSLAFQAQTGVAAGRAVRTSGVAGHLLHGRLGSLPAGRYRLAILGVITANVSGAGSVELSIEGHSPIYAELPPLPVQNDDLLLTMTFDIAKGPAAVAICISVAAETEMNILRIRIEPLIARATYDERPGPTLDDGSRSASHQ